MTDVGYVAVGWVVTGAVLATFQAWLVLRTRRATRHRDVR